MLNSDFCIKDEQVPFGVCPQKTPPDCEWCPRKYDIQGFTSLRSCAAKAGAGAGLRAPEARRRGGRAGCWQQQRGLSVSTLSVALIWDLEGWLSRESSGDGAE